MVSTTVIRQYSDGEPKLEELFGRKGLIDNPKPPALIEKFILQTTSKNDLVLDFLLALELPVRQLLRPTEEMKKSKVYSDRGRGLF